MYQATADFIAAVQGSHTAVLKAQVVNNGDVLYDFTVVDGSASANGGDSIRRECSIELLDTNGNLMPKEAGDLLMPFGTEVQLKRGVRFTSGVEELIPWGLFRLDSFDATNSEEGLSITIGGYDRAFMAQQLSSKPVIIQSGMKYEEAIAKMVASRINTADQLLMDTGYKTPTLFLKAGIDVWEEARNAAKSVGCEVYFDVIGNLVLAPMTPDAMSVITYSPAAKNVMGISRAIQADGLPNGIVVIGEHSSLSRPVRGEAWDLNPKSPTYRFGQYGEVIRTDSSEYVITDGQAKAMAQGTLERELGPYETLNIETVPNPAHDLNDVIYVEWPALGIAGYYVITDIDMPWSTADTMTLTARKKIVNDEG